MILTEFLTLNKTGLSLNMKAPEYFKQIRVEFYRMIQVFTILVNALCVVIAVDTGKCLAQS